MTEPRKPPPEKGVGARRRLGLLARGARGCLTPFCLVVLCLVVCGGLAFVLYPYVEKGAWFRNVAAGATSVTVVGVFTRFWGAVRAGFQTAVAMLRPGWEQVRLAFRKESTGPAVTPGAGSEGGAGRLFAAAFALVASLRCLLVVCFAAAFNLVRASPALSGPVPVEGFRLGGSPTFRSTIFFPEEASFEDWIPDCSLDTPCFDAYESGVLEFLRPFLRCVSDPEERLQLRLRGFASSSGLKWPPDRTRWKKCAVWEKCLVRERCDVDGSSVDRQCIERAFNLCVAEERAPQAQAWMETLSPIDGRFEVDAVSWNSHRKMAAQQIVDRENGRYDGTTGALNRRVELTVVDAGACRVVTRELGVESLPGREFAEWFLAWSESAHSELTSWGGDLLEFFRGPVSHTGVEETRLEPGGVGR